MSKSSFNKGNWANRLGVALQQIAAHTRPIGFAFRTEHLPIPGSKDLYDKVIDRLCRQLASQAKTRLGGCAIEHFSECSVGISKRIKLFCVAIVGYISANESIVQPKVVNDPIEIFYGADS